MLSIHDILLGILLPWMLGAAMVVAGAWRKRAIGGALGVGLGFVMGCALLFGWPGVPPGNVFDWVVIAAGATAVIAAIGEWSAGISIGYKVAGFIVFAAMTGLLVRLQVGWGWMAGLTVLGWGWWLAWDELLGRSSGAWAGMVMTGMAGCGSLVLMLSDSQRFGQMGLALAGAMAGVWVCGWLMKRDVWRGSAGTWAVVFYGLLLDGKFWGPDSGGLIWTNGVLLLAGMTAAWAGNLPAARNWSGWKRGMVRIIAVILPVGVAVILAIIEFQRAQQAVGAEYY